MEVEESTEVSTVGRKMPDPDTGTEAATGMCITSQEQGDEEEGGGAGEQGHSGGGFSATTRAGDVSGVPVPGHLNEIGKSPVPGCLSEHKASVPEHPKHTVPVPGRTKH